jgi:hypothetical protein
MLDRINPLALPAGVESLAKSGRTRKNVAARAYRSKIAGYHRR